MHAHLRGHPACKISAQQVPETWQYWSQVQSPALTVHGQSVSGLQHPMFSAEQDPTGAARNNMHVHLQHLHAWL